MVTFFLILMVAAAFIALFILAFNFYDTFTEEEKKSIIEAWRNRINDGASGNSVQ